MWRLWVDSRLQSIFATPPSNMAAWLIPALKTVLPHVGTIISVAMPVFTKKKTDDAATAAADQAQLLQQQIGELQTTASQNSAHIKQLAAQLESTLAALEVTAALAEAKIRWAIRLALAATAISAVALGAALFLLFAH